MKIKKIIALMLLSGCLIIGTNIAYADCKDTRTFEQTIPALTFFDIEDLKKIEGNENKSTSEIQDWFYSEMDKYVKEKLTPDLYADEDLGTIELDGANLFKVLPKPACGRQDTPYSISDEIKNKTFELAKSKIEGLSDLDKPYSAYYDSERKAYYCAFTKRVNIPITGFYGKTIDVKTEKNYNVYIKEKKDQIFIDDERLNNYLSENPNVDVNKEYLSILYNVLKEQEGDKIKNIEEYPEDTSFHKEGNHAYVYGYVTNNDGEKILTKIWINLLEFYGNEADFPITINEIESGLSEENVNKINNILKKYNENIFYVGGYKLDNNILKPNFYNNKDYYIDFKKGSGEGSYWAYRFNFKIKPDFTFDSILKNFDLNSEKYSKYKDFNNLMIKKYNCELNKIKEYISSSDGKENINSYVKNKDESFTLLKTDVLNEYAKDYIILESKNGKNYLVKINNLIVPAVKLYENPLDKEETITEEDKHNIDKVFRHYFKDLYKSTEFVSDKVRIDPCGRAYLKVKIFFNDNVFNELETEIRVNRTIADRIPYCPPTVAYDPNTNSYHETCYTEEMCLSNRYRFEILDPNNFSENVECTPEKSDIPNEPDEPEKPIVPNVPNNKTPATPSNIPSNNSTPREKTNTTVVPKQNDEKTPITIVNAEEKIITENDFQEGKNPNSLIKRDIKTGDNLFTITILMLFGILGVGGNWFCDKLDNVKKRE